VLSSSRLKWVVLTLALLLPLGFAFFTSHAWEDYYITLRSSRNLVEGNGLVFNPGERVHTFTSPLGVLVPAACTWIVGVDHEESALWLFRVFSACCLVGAVWLVWRRIDCFGLAPISRLLLFGLILFDGKLIDFSINGMETAMLVLFAMMLWSELEAPDGPRWHMLALAFGGLMWTRPDAFILTGALILPHFVFRKRASGSSSIPWSPLLRGLICGGLIYLPWFLWAWWYYGSPIPNTIIAKSTFMPPVHLGDLLLSPAKALIGGTKILYLYLPSYWKLGGWPEFLKVFSYLLSLIGLFSWLSPSNSAESKRASLTIFLGMFYLNSIVLYPWYIPPWTIIQAVVVALVFDHWLSLAMKSRTPLWRSLLRVTAGVLILLQVAVFLATAWQSRVQQRVIEYGVRKEIGLWLKNHAHAGDSVFMEPLGYIGYYSRLKTYDFPGLSAPEVVAALRSDSKDFSDLIAKFHPTWLALRPHEVAMIALKSDTVLANYKLEKMWDATAMLDDVSFLFGRMPLEFDARFLLFHRKNVLSDSTQSSAR